MLSELHYIPSHEELLMYYCGFIYSGMRNQYQLLLVISPSVSVEAVRV